MTEHPTDMLDKGAVLMVTSTPKDGVYRAAIYYLNTIPGEAFGATPMQAVGKLLTPLDK